MVVKVTELYPSRQGRAESREYFDEGAGVGVVNDGHAALRNSIITYYEEMVTRDGDIVYRKAD